MLTRPVSISDNSPELLDLTVEEQTSIKAALDGLEALKKTFDHWVMIGHGLRTLREKAARMNSRFAFDRMRHQAGLGTLNKATVSLLLKIVDNLPEVVKWREALTSTQRFEWVSPSAINKHCPLFKRHSTSVPRDRVIPQELSISAVESMKPTQQLQDTERELETEQAPKAERIKALEQQVAEQKDAHELNPKDRLIKAMLEFADAATEFHGLSEDAEDVFFPLIVVFTNWVRLAGAEDLKRLHDDLKDQHEWGRDRLDGFCRLADPVKAAFPDSQEKREALIIELTAAVNKRFPNPVTRLTNCLLGTH